MAWKKGSLPTSLSRAPVTKLILEWYSFWSGSSPNHFGKITFHFVSFRIGFGRNSIFSSHFFVCVARCSKKDVLAHKLLRMFYDTHSVDLLSSSLLHSHAPLMLYKNPMQIFEKKKSPNDAEKWKRAHSEENKSSFRKWTENEGTTSEKNAPWIGSELSSSSYK